MSTPNRESPHTYNDEEFARWASDLDEAIGGLWEAGASTDDIKAQVENALLNLDT